MSSIVITIKTPKDYTTVTKTGQRNNNHNKIINILSGMAVGALTGAVYVSGSTSDPVAASGTLTLASVADTNTAVIGGVTLTAKTSPAGQAQFLRGVSDTADAAALAACINAHTSLKLIVSATSALGVVTVTANHKGVLGNYITTTATGNITAGGAALANGAGGSDVAPVQIR